MNRTDKPVILHLIGGGKRVFEKWSCKPSGTVTGKQYGGARRKLDFGLEIDAFILKKFWRLKMANFPYRTASKDFPEQFLSSLRVLFDILDEERTGYVRVGDIESRWNNGVAGLPKGIPEALHKVTPPSGKLSFDRFVAGLKIALLGTNDKANGRNGLPGPDTGGLRDDSESNSASVSGSASGSGRSNDSQQPRSAPLPDHRHISAKPKVQSHSRSQVQTPKQSFVSGPNMATVRPNNAILAHQPQNREALHSAPEPEDLRGSRTSQQLQPSRPFTAEPLRPPQLVHNLATTEVHSQPVIVGRGPGDGRSSVASASALNNYGNLCCSVVHGGLVFASEWSLHIWNICSMDMVP